MEGNSGRTVDSILGIRKNMYLYQIKKYANEIEEKIQQMIEKSNRNGQTLQLCKRKKTNIRI